LYKILYLNIKKNIIFCINFNFHFKLSMILNYVDDKHEKRDTQRKTYTVIITCFQYFKSLHSHKSKH